MDVPGATYRLIGGAPALDLVNSASWYATGEGRGRDPLDRIGKERLVVGEDVVRWGIAAGLLGKHASPTDGSARALARLRRLRRAIYHLFKAAIEGWPVDPADLEILDGECREARQAQRLSPAKVEWRWEWRDEPTPELEVIRVVALDASHLLTSAHLDQVKQCAGDDCGWLFLDVSRNHRRRWCEMSDCGNLANVRRFRRQR